MTVMNLLSRKLIPGSELKTPVQAREFLVESIQPSRVTLILGEGFRTPIPAECWDGIPRFLRGKGWVAIGSTRGKTKPGTLEHYVDGFIPRRAANYVASVLEQVGVVEIDRHKPSSVRLIEGGLT